SDFEASVAMDMAGRKMYVIGDRLAEVIDLDTKAYTDLRSKPWAADFVRPVWQGGYTNGPGIAWQARTKQIVAWVNRNHPTRHTRPDPRPAIHVYPPTHSRSDARTHPAGSGADTASYPDVEPNPDGHTDSCPQSYSGGHIATPVHAHRRSLDKGAASSHRAGG